MRHVMEAALLAAGEDSPRSLHCTGPERTRMRNKAMSQRLLGRGTRLQMWLLVTPPLWRLATGVVLGGIGLAGLAQSFPKLQSPATQRTLPQPAVAAGGPPSVWEARCPFDFAADGELAAAHAARVDKSGSIWRSLGWRRNKTRSRCRRAQANK